MENRGSSLYKDLHMTCFHIYKVKSTLTTWNNEWERIFVKAVESIERILVDVLNILIVDSSLDFPILNNEDVLLSSKEGEFILSKFANTLNGFCFEQDWFLFHVSWCSSHTISIEWPTHDPSILHSVSLVDVVCVLVGNWSCTNLEGHHPSFTTAVEIWGTSVALDQSIVAIFLVVKTVECVHIFIKD